MSGPIQFDAMQIASRIACRLGILTEEKWVVAAELAALPEEVRKTIVTAIRKAAEKAQRNPERVRLEWAARLVEAVDLQEMRVKAVPDVMADARKAGGSKAKPGGTGDGPPGQGGVGS
jgi:hypothetical protein